MKSEQLNHWLLEKLPLDGCVDLDSCQFRRQIESVSRALPVPGKFQDFMNNFCTMLRVKIYTLRRDRCLVIGEDTCHGASTGITDLTF